MPKIPFAYEDDLCAVLDRHLEGIVLPQSESGRVRALAQRPVGPVIPDFIYVRSEGVTGEEHDLPASGGLTALEASIVATLLSGRSLRGETIARRLYSRVDRITVPLKSLERQGIIEKFGGDVFALRRGAVPHSAQVVAVEAKLRRWREATAQAASYLLFANQSYVALPQEVITNNRALRAAAASARVGVLGVTPNSVQLVRRAPYHRTRSADWIWLLSRTVRFLQPS
jgi:hypothetical protein